MATCSTVHVHDALEEITLMPSILLPRASALISPIKGYEWYMYN